VWRRQVALGPFPVAEHPEQNDVAFSIPLHGQERQGHAVHGLRLANADDVDQHPRLRWRGRRGGVVRGAGIAYERDLPAR
jgi:hypothetical protein